MNARQAQKKTLEYLQQENYNEVIKLHMGLIQKVAGKFVAYASAKDVEFDDLVQVASLEMFTSCKSYNPSKGMSFSSYAFRNMQRTLTNKLHSDSFVGLGHLEVSEQLVGEYSIDADYRFMLSDVLSIVYDEINGDTQWIAFMAFMEDQSFMSIQDEVGVSHQALSKALKTLFNKTQERAMVELV